MPAFVNGRKEFLVIVSTTPKLLAPGNRGYAFVVTTDADIYIGSDNSVTGTWMRLPAGQGYSDTLTQDPYYARTLTGSGTATGWYA